MRSNQIWEKKIFQQKLKYFTPRLQRDLKIIPFPKKINTLEKSIFLQGATGAGKTIYASQIALAYLKQQYLTNKPDSFCFIAFDQMVNEVKKIAGEGFGQEITVFDKYSKNYTLLLIDDILTTKPTDWIYHLLYSIINQRYENNLLTIITSNWDLNQLSEKLGDDRITSRIERSYLILKKEPYA